MKFFHILEKSVINIFDKILFELFLLSHFEVKKVHKKILNLNVIVKFLKAPKQLDLEYDKRKKLSTIQKLFDLDFLVYNNKHYY